MHLITEITYDKEETEHQNKEIPIINYRGKKISKNKSNVGKNM